MKPLPTSHLRIARPSHDTRAAERFWGLGLSALFRADDSTKAGHPLLIDLEVVISYTISLDAALPGVLFVRGWVLLRPYRHALSDGLPSLGAGVRRWGLWRTSSGWGKLTGLKMADEVAVLE